MIKEIKKMNDFNQPHWLNSCIDWNTWKRKGGASAFKETIVYLPLCLYKS